jgi:hypothetical protein
MREHSQLSESTSALLRAAVTRLTALALSELLPNRFHQNGRPT